MIPMQPAALTTVTKIARLLNLTTKNINSTHYSKTNYYCLFRVVQSSSLLLESEVSAALDRVIVPVYTPSYPDRVTLLPDPLENVTVACRSYSASRALSSSTSSYVPSGKQ